MKPRLQSRTRFRATALAVLALITLQLGACKDPVPIEAKITSLSVEPNPVPAPTAGTPSTFTVAWTVDTQGDAYGYEVSLGVSPVMDAPSAPRAWILSNSCAKDCDPDAVRRMQCEVSLPPEGGKQRKIQCHDPAGDPRPVMWTAGPARLLFNLGTDPKVIMHDHDFFAWTEMDVTLQ